MPSADDYRTFQDYIFRYLVSEGGRLRLPCAHSHGSRHRRLFRHYQQQHHGTWKTCCATRATATSPLVMIHGGYPLEREAIWLAAMKNVYMDSSLMEIDMYPSEFKNTLKQWLELFPTRSRSGPTHSVQ